MNAEKLNSVQIAFGSLVFSVFCLNLTKIRRINPEKNQQKREESFFSDYFKNKTIQSYHTAFKNDTKTNVRHTKDLCRDVTVDVYFTAARPVRRSECRSVR